jgi:threonine dehydrogenase-like Zn-dependent dehydrogenase
MADIVAGSIDPSPVLDYTVSLDDVPAAFAAMAERRAIKALVKLGN